MWGDFPFRFVVLERFEALLLRAKPLERKARSGPPPPPPKTDSCVSFNNNTPIPVSRRFRFRFRFGVPRRRRRRTRRDVSKDFGRTDYKG